MRKNIYDVLHTGNISLKTEYKRLYSLMHQDEWEVEQELTSIYYLSEHSCKYFEPMRKKLKAIAPSIESTLFQLFQKFVRHNYRSHPHIRGLSDREIEECYDDIYQMWLLAKLELDNVERTRKVKRILDEINSSKE